MAILTKRRNNWMENREKIPKILINYFLVIQMCFDLDCGFLSIFDVKYRCLLKNILRIKSIAVLIGISYPLWNFTVDQLFYVLYSVRYAICLIIFTFSKDNLYNYLLSTVEILTWKQLNELKRLGFAAIAYTIVIVCLKIFANVIYCTYVIKSCASFLSPGALVYLPLIALDLIPVIQVISLLCVYLNLNSMIEMFWNEMSFVRISSKYVSIAVCWDKIQYFYGKLTLVSVVFDTPKLMILLWRILYFFKIKAGWFIFGVQLVMVMFISIHIFVPVFIVEMVNAKSREIQLYLNNILIKETISDETKTEVLNLLEYMEERRILDNAWNVFPIDLRLSHKIISVCVTYLIVIIQFTHIYD